MSGNVMCRRNSALVALIDWGDAGWGDPAHELGSLAIEAVPHVVAGYEAAGGGLAGSEAMILWDQIGGAVDSVETAVIAPDAITALLAFARCRAAVAVQVAVASSSHRAHRADVASNIEAPNGNSSARSQLLYLRTTSRT
jgi:aminoglycoside phosphotransferase (APT) family kinase protein